MDKGVRLALIGCGKISAEHISGYRDLFERGCREFEITACCHTGVENARKRATEIAEFQGTQPEVFTDIQELIKSGIADAADVTVPHCYHHTVAVSLLAGGLHVLLEKPLGITIKASRKIIEAAKQHDRVLATAENIRRYLPPRSCEWAINKEKIIGDVQAVDVRFINHFPIDYTNRRAKWRAVKSLSGGGMIMDSGAHFADMMLHVFGQVEDVYCVMKTYNRQTIEDVPIVGKGEVDVEDAWCATIRFWSGMFVSWMYSRSFHGEPILSANYYGTKGTMQDTGFVFHPFKGGGNVVLHDGSTVSSGEIQRRYLASLSGEDKDRLFPYGCMDGFGIEMWDFVNAITKRGKPEIDGTDGLRAKTLCECCYESATIGKTVRFDDVLNGRINEYQKPIDEFWRI